MRVLRGLIPGAVTLLVLACDEAVPSSPDRAASRPTEHDAGGSADVALGASDTTTAAFDPESYDRTCRTNYDCMPVWKEPCDVCVCTDIAINVAVSESYMDGLFAQQAREGCSHLGLPGGPCASSTCDPSPIATCENGRCEVTKDRKLDVDSYDQSCETDTDCVGVHESLCHVRGDCTHAIAKSAQGQLDADRRAAPPCGVSEPAPSCRGSAYCAGGRCQPMPSEVP